MEKDYQNFFKHKKNCQNRPPRRPNELKIRQRLVPDARSPNPASESAENRLKHQKTTKDNKKHVYKREFHTKEYKRSQKTTEK